MLLPRPERWSYFVRATLLVGAMGCSSTPRSDAPAASSVSVTTSASTTVSVPALSAAPGVPRACFPASLERAEIASVDVTSETTLTVCLTSGSVGHEPVRATPAPPLVTVDLDSGPATVEVTCLSVDRVSKQLRALPTKEAVVEWRPTRRERQWTLAMASENELTICPPNDKGYGCKAHWINRQHAVDGGHGGESSRRLIASLSPDGQQVAVLVVERGSMVGTWSVKVDTYDRASRRRLTRTPVSVQPIEDPRVVFFDASDLWSVEWRGERLELRAQRCCGPDGRSVLLDPATGALEPLGDPVVAREVKPGVLLFDAPGEPFGEDGAPLTLTLLHMPERRRVVVPLAATRLGVQGRGVEVRPWKGSLWAVVHTFPPAVEWLDVEREAIVDQLRLPVCP